MAVSADLGVDRHPREEPDQLGAILFRQTALQPLSGSGEGIDRRLGGCVALGGREGVQAGNELVSLSADALEGGF